MSRRPLILDDLRADAGIGGLTLGAGGEGKPLETIAARATTKRG